MKTLVAVTLVSLLAISSVQAETVVDTSGFSPLPVNANLPGITPSSTQIALGKKLFLDKRLSLAKDISCNSCHKLDGFGVDNEATSAGHKGQRGNRNSPTVYNAALHFAQFWDGRAADVEAQALGPVQNPVEMAMPSEPGWVGSSERSLRPYSVTSEGEGCTVPPNTSIIARRYGFWS